MPLLRALPLLLLASCGWGLFDSGPPTCEELCLEDRSVCQSGCEYTQAQEVCHESCGLEYDACLDECGDEEEED